MDNTLSPEELTLVHRPMRPIDELARGFAGGINFGFFNSRGEPTGPVIVDGEVQTWWDPSAHWHAIIRYTDGTAEIRKSPERWWPVEVDRDSIDWMCGAGPIVLQDGEIGIVDGDRFSGTQLDVKRARVAVGIREDGKVHLSARPSATAREMAEHLLGRGCVDGMLGDGGGSASWYEDGRVRLGGGRDIPNALCWGEAPGFSFGDILGDSVNDIQVHDNFNLSEFQCRHCGSVKIHPELIRRLQQIRNKFKAPLIITSGYRCQTHNAAVGGSPGSQHTKGTAADIRVSGVTNATVADYCEDLFSDGGLGRYSGHTHVDVRGNRARWEG